MDITVKKHIGKKLNNYDDIRGISESLVCVRRNGNWGFINEEGEEVVKPIYNDIVYDEKIAIVKKNNSLYIVDLNIPTYEVSVDSQDRIIKRQFSNENEADEFKDYIKVYIDKQIKRKDKEEDELTEVFMALEKQYEEDL